MRCLAVLLCCAAVSLAAQTPPTGDTTRRDTAPRPPTPPPPPTLEQKRFLDGLRTATRGIAQLKDGLARVARAGHDSASARRAGRFLAEVCGSGRAFFKRGRPQLTPTVYEDSVRVKARRLVTQLDSLSAYALTCEQTATAAPDVAATEVGKRLKTYDAALRDFRLAIGLPVKEDTAKVSKRR